MIKSLSPKWLLTAALVLSFLCFSAPAIQYRPSAGFPQKTLVTAKPGGLTKSISFSRLLKINTGSLALFTSGINLKELHDLLVQSKLIQASNSPVPLQTHLLYHHKTTFPDKGEPEIALV